MEHVLTELCTRGAATPGPSPSPYVDLSRAEWSALRERTPLPLTAEEVERLRGLGTALDLDEVRDVYLPLSRLLNLYIHATHELRGTLGTFLDTPDTERTRTPFIIGVAARSRSASRRRPACSRPCSPAGPSTRGSSW